MSGVTFVPNGNQNPMPPASQDTTPPEWTEATFVAALRGKGIHTVGIGANGVNWFRQTLAAVAAGECTFEAVIAAFTDYQQSFRGVLAAAKAAQTEEISRGHPWHPDNL